MKRKNIFFVFLIIFLCVLYFLFGEKNTNESILKLGVINIKKEGLNPLFVRNSENIFIVNLLFNSLFDTKLNINEKDSIAKGLKVSEDKRTVYVYLKRNVYFHNGKLLDSQDVKWTYSCLIDKSKDTYFSKYSLIKKIKVKNKFCIEFDFKDKVYFPYYFFSYSILPFIKETSLKNSSFTFSPIGTGKYKLLKINEKGDLWLVKNDNYFGNKKWLFDKVFFKSYSDKKAQWAGFLKGEIDVFYNLEHSQYELIKNEDWCCFYKTYGLSCEVLKMNPNSMFLRDLKVRNAIDYAIDRNMIVDKVYQGFADGRNILFYDKDKIKSIRRNVGYDIEKAKELLKQAGFSDKDNDGVLEKNGKRLNLRLLVNVHYKNSVKIAKIIKLNLWKIGIDVTVIPINTVSYNKNEYDMIIKNNTVLNFIPWIQHSMDCLDGVPEKEKIIDYCKDAMVFKKMNEDEIREIVKTILGQKIELYLTVPYRIFAVNKKFSNIGIDIANEYFSLYMVEPLKVKGGGNEI